MLFHGHYLLFGLDVRCCCAVSQAEWYEFVPFICPLDPARFIADHPEHYARYPNLASTVAGVKTMWLGRLVVTQPDTRRCPGFYR